MRMFELLNFVDFYEVVQNQKVRFSLSYKLAMLKQEYDKNIEFFQSELNKIIQEYGKRDENGKIIGEDNHIEIEPSLLMECQEKMNELNNIIVEIPEAYYIQGFELEELELTPKETNIIIPFISM